MPHGKLAGIPCVQLLPDYRCALFGKPERPASCVSLRPTEEMCGTCRDKAMASLTELERLTAPTRTDGAGDAKSQPNAALIVRPSRRTPSSIRSAVLLLKLSQSVLRTAGPIQNG